MAVAAMQGANQHIRSSLGLSIFDMQTRGIEPATFQLQDAGTTPEISRWKLLLTLNKISYVNFISPVHPKKSQRCSPQ